MEKAKLVWIDLETTGLDPVEGDVLEIAIILTDDKLNELAVFESLVVPGDGVKAALYLMNDFVLNMHTENGLIEELHETEKRGDCKHSDVNSQVLRFFIDNGLVGSNPAKPYLAGSTISFDRKWMDVHFPRIDEVIHYRNLDVTALKITRELFRPDLPKAPKKEGTHRALADIRNSIQELRHYLKTLIREVE